MAVNSMKNSQDSLFDIKEVTGKAPYGSTSWLKEKLCFLVDTLLSNPLEKVYRYNEATECFEDDTTPSMRIAMLSTGIKAAALLHQINTDQEAKTMPYIDYAPDRIYFELLGQKEQGKGECNIPVVSTES